MNRPVHLCILAILLIVSQAVGYAADEATEQVLQVDKNLNKTLLQPDLDALDRILSDGFACKTGDAAFIRKDALIEFAKANGSPWQSITDLEKTAQVYGNTVILMGISKRTYKGTGDTVKFRFTKIYSKMTDRWQLVAMHAEQLP